MHSVPYIQKYSLITHFQSNNNQGDYFRLGHGSDQHLRKPTPIQGLRGKKVVHVAVGALHCLAVTDTGEVNDFLFSIQMKF